MADVLDLEKWPPFKKGKWRFLSKVASGITGRRCKVLPGAPPQVDRDKGRDYYSRILLPKNYTGLLLGGSLAHELLHVLHSQPQAFDGLAFGTRYIANCLEDARVEIQLEGRWKGLVGLVDKLNRTLAEFIIRKRSQSYNIQVSRLCEVGFALYLLLKRFPEETLRRWVSEMALATARELLPLAEPAREARDSFEVVEIAKKILDEINRAAEKAAQKINTPAARTWTKRLQDEVKIAQQTPWEDVEIGPPRREPSPDWDGPWWMGRGTGHPFYNQNWEWDVDDPLHELRPLSNEEVRTLIQLTDPTMAVTGDNPHLTGRLPLSSETLVKAVVGKEQRLLVETEERRRPILPGLFSQVEVCVFVEAHPGRQKSPMDPVLLKSFVASLGRLFTALEVPVLVVRAYNVTKVKKRITVKNPRTGETREKMTLEYLVHVSTIKSPKTQWDEACERKLAAMPLQGFNLPFKGWPAMRAWKISLPSSNRLRFYIVVGQAGNVNVLFGDGSLKRAASLLRHKGAKAIYVNVGPPIEEHNPWMKNFKESFDGFVQEHYIGGLVYSLLQEMLRLFM